jgi:hypothetical protein
MVLAGSYRAVVDRFPDGLAVLVVYRDGEPIDELALERAALPPGCRRVGAAVTVRLAAGRVTGIEPAGDDGTSEPED